jgi:hypothetical protein
MKVSRQTPNRRLLVTFLIASAVAASLAGSTAPAPAAQPVTSFQRNFSLSGGQSAEFKVTLRGSTQYTAKASASGGGHLELRVLRYWQGDKKYDRTVNGGPATHSFTSYQQDREYTFKVKNPQNSGKSCQISISTGYGGGGGGGTAPQYVYDVSVSAKQFTGYKSTESGGEEYCPSYFVFLANKPLFSKLEVFKGAKEGKPYPIRGSGSKTVDDPNTQITLSADCIESDEGEPLGGDDDNLGKETKNIRISDYLGTNTVKVGNPNYTLEFEVTVRRRQK